MAVTALLDACASMADMGLTDPAHEQARARYQSAKTGWEASTSRLSSLAPRAQTAREALAADQAKRDASAVIITAGDQNETVLLTMLRTTITDAVSSGQLLPVWLHTTMGPMPPAGHATEWIDTATHVLAYRVTHQVHDPVDPLGPVPPDASHRRRTWSDRFLHKPGHSDHDSATSAASRHASRPSDFVTAGRHTDEVAHWMTRAGCPPRHAQSRPPAGIRSEELQGMRYRHDGILPGGRGHLRSGVRPTGSSSTLSRSHDHHRAELVTVTGQNP